MPMDNSLSWESVVFVWPLTIAAGKHLRVRLVEWQKGRGQRG